MMDQPLVQRCFFRQPVGNATVRPRRQTEQVQAAIRLGRIGCSTYRHSLNRAGQKSAATRFAGRNHDVDRSLGVRHGRLEEPPVANDPLNSASHSITMTHNEDRGWGRANNLTCTTVSRLALSRFVRQPESSFQKTKPVCADRRSGRSDRKMNSGIPCSSTFSCFCGRYSESESPGDPGG